MCTTRLCTFSMLVLCYIAGSAVCQPAKRPLQPADYYRLQVISDLQVSSDGNWIAYALTSTDSTKDRKNSDIWMVSWDGKQNVQLTNSPDGESKPRFSPDGRFLSFTAKRDEDMNRQIYLLDRRGGEATRLTNVKGELEDYVWSPDGSKILLVIKDPDLSDTAKTKIRVPYVIDRFHFKQDYEGYLDRRATHLYLMTIATKQIDTLTRGIYNEVQPSFSPDGSQIAFVSNRTEDPDKNENYDIYVMHAKSGSEMKKLTTWPGTDQQPVWSPDGKSIAYLQSSSNELFTMYGHEYLAVLAAGGGEPRLLSRDLDRPVENQRWNKHGTTIFALIHDDRQRLIGSFNSTTGQLTRVADGEQNCSNLTYNKAFDSWVCLMSTPQRPAEIFALEKGAMRRVTHVQDTFLLPIQLAKVEGFQSKSKDGALISCLLYRPPVAATNKKLPLIIVPHGGPVGQADCDKYSFDFHRQMLAAAGYAVAAVNFRGSSGRGVDFIRSIYGDWGNKEVIDIIGAVDHLVKQGIIDEQRMGIAGWSYGGILTNYVIATDQRFKAAVSGASSSLQLTIYGVDQWVNQYHNELGPPWKNPDKWIKLSYPFFQVERIKTPTLFMASQNDLNVPAVGAEQMYQAFRTLGIPTELVIYPNQNHGISVPSYIKDRDERWIWWFDKYLK